jgi:hypothetical protein
MPLILISLSLLDIFSGILIFLHSFPFMQVIFYFALFSLFKGFWTLTSALGSTDLFSLALGAIDLIAGICLILITKNIILNIFPTIGAIVLLKGIFCLILSL